MLTQCPGCQTVFRVTSTILRAAHGQVRCGRCNTQFDAIEALLEGEDSQALESTGSHIQAALSVGDSSGYIEEKLDHEDIVLEGNRIEISGVYQRLDSADSEEHATHSRTIIEEFNIGTEAWENPFDPLAEGGTTESSDIDENEVADIEHELNAASLADAINSLDTLPTKGATALNPAAVQPDDIVHTAAVAAAVPTTFSLASAPVPASPAMRATAPFDVPFELPASPRRWPWLIASIVLTLALAAQALHHSREVLARHPSIGPQLSKLYAAIGQPLTPQWQLSAYSIKQWGIVADPQASGTLRVRASIANGANFAQPYPLLRLSLEDRFGGKVGKREFKPEEYLGSAAQATRLLAAGEAANVDLTIVDPGQEAVGFQFDTCLQLPNGLRCAHELPSQ